MNGIVKADFWKPFQFLLVKMPFYEMNNQLLDFCSCRNQNWRCYIYSALWKERVIKQNKICTLFCSLCQTK